MQAAVRKPQKVLEGAQEMAGSNLGEKNEDVELIEAEKKREEGKIPLSSENQC